MDLREQILEIYDEANLFETPMYINGNDGNLQNRKRTKNGYKYIRNKYNIDVPVRCLIGIFEKCSDESKRLLVNTFRDIFRQAKMELNMKNDITFRAQVIHEQEAIREQKVHDVTAHRMAKVDENERPLRDCVKIAIQNYLNQIAEKCDIVLKEVSSRYNGSERVVFLNCCWEEIDENQIEETIEMNRRYYSSKNKENFFIRAEPLKRLCHNEDYRKHFVEELEKRNLALSRSDGGDMSGIVW